VSSVAVAHEVDLMGGRSIACLNARDRNVLGLRRDLLTASAYGVDEFLFVYGDQPAAGERTGQLTVRSMIEHLRRFGEEYHGRPDAFRVGVTTRLLPLPAWIQFDGDMYVGVMVVPSPAMARKLMASIPEITVPPRWLEAIERDRDAAVELACELAEAVAESRAFQGVHLVPGVRYRQVAARLEPRM
jgi:5,10-methylenetetrahydrofolate reductase